MNSSYSLNQFLQKHDQEKTVNKHPIATKKKQRRNELGYRLLKHYIYKGAVLKGRVVRRRYDLMTAVNILKTRYYAILN